MTFGLCSKKWARAVPAAEFQAIRLRELLKLHCKEHFFIREILRPRLLNLIH